MSTSQVQKTSLLSSIQTKIVLMTIVIVTVVLGAFTAYSAWQSKKKMTTELNQLAESTSTRLASHLINPLWDLDEELVNEIVVAEMTEKRLFGVIVRDSDNKTIFAAQKRNQSWQPVKYNGLQLGTKDLVFKSSPISNGNDHLGQVEVYLSPRFLNEELEANFVNMLLQVIVLDLIIFIAMFIALRTMVIKPINTLAEAAEAMSKGDFDTEIDLESNNEIGQVAAAMNRMKTSLKLAMGRMGMQQAA